jgi:hypothetical protein
MKMIIVTRRQNHEDGAETKKPPKPSRVSDTGRSQVTHRW